MIAQLNQKMPVFLHRRGCLLSPFPSLTRLPLFFFDFVIFGLESLAFNISLLLSVWKTAPEDGASLQATQQEHYQPEVAVYNKHHRNRNWKSFPNVAVF